MQIHAEQRGAESIIRVEGTIQGVQEAADLKRTLTEQAGAGAGSITLVLSDTPVLPSSVIGALLRLVEIEKVEVSLRVRSPELRESLKKLNFETILHVQGM